MEHYTCGGPDCGEYVQYPLGAVKNGIVSNVCYRGKYMNDNGCANLFSITWSASELIS